LQFKSTCFSIAVFSTLVLCLVVPFVSNSQQLTADQRAISPELFGLNIPNVKTSPWPTVQFDGWRNFHSSWMKIEPAKGVWKFETLDDDVRLAQEHGVQLLLSLGTTPTWASARPSEKGCCAPGYPMGSAAEPRDINDWRNYVRTVATRYKGKVKYYELWNEANMSPASFTGNVSQLGELSREAYKTLKSVDPGITVVSPALSSCCNAVGFMKQYFAGGWGEYADAIGFHFYTGYTPPETMLAQIERVRAAMAEAKLANKPLWDTEIGWISDPKNPRSISESQAAAYLARTYILSWAAHVDRVYWYAWDADLLGMIFPGDANHAVRKEPIIKAYSDVRDWLVGATMKSCSPDPAYTWVCELRRGPSYVGHIVWNPNRNIQFQVPAAWSATQVRALDGTVAKVTPSVSVTGSPVLIENAR
jgi:hypothetical protein